MTVDFDRLEDRIIALPAPQRNYERIVARKPGIFFLVESVVEPQAVLSGRAPSTSAENLYRFVFATKKMEKFLEGVRKLDLSHDGGKMRLPGTPLKVATLGNS